MTIETELLALKNADGLILAEDALDWARSHPGSDLHGAIEWDVNTCAREHQLWQVRRLIALNIKFESGLRSVVSLSVDRTRRPGGGYRQVDDVLHDKSLYDIMIQDALNELERLRLKYEALKQLEPVWAAVAKVKRRRGRPRKEIRASA